MAKESLNKIFLSASIPYPERDRKYYNTADIMAIRDAVKGLAAIVIPKMELVWGGHPAITPLVREVVGDADGSLKKYVTLYQSNYFKGRFPQEVGEFEDVQFTEAATGLFKDEEEKKAASLEIMRRQMLGNNRFVAGIFVGGMEGVEAEYRIFRELQPNALALPVASTGAAAKIIYDSMEPKPDKRLLDGYAYMALFRDLLTEYR
jgi:hypothetical protein